MIPDLIIEQAQLDNIHRKLASEMPGQEILRSRHILRAITAPEFGPGHGVEIPAALYGRSFAVPSGPRTGRERVVITRSKWMQKGRVDPSATFHGIAHEVATEIDCHKSRISRTPTKAQIRETEEEDVRSLLDAWEQRTGKTAPSRRL